MLTWAEKSYFEHLFEKQAILSILFQRKAILTHKSFFVRMIEKPANNIN